jgi:predicted double-glycine peptidase
LARSPVSRTATALRRSGAPRLALLALAAGLRAPSPARAQVRLTNETGGNFTVAVMSWWEIPFRTVIRQQYDFSCGSAAVATLLTYSYAVPTPERIAFKRMWDKGDKPVIRKVGFSMFDMKSYLDGLGYHAEGFRMPIERLMSLKRPAIVLLNLNGYKHFVVVKGARGDRVLLGDPALGLTQYTREDFQKVWNGIALAIVKTPNDSEVRYNVARDWGPWSTAPLEHNGLHVSVAELTTNLPPTYQLTPQMLLDVRIGTGP